MKNILFLLTLSLLLISCWYENEDMAFGTVVTENDLFVLLIRDKIDRSKITVISYGFEEGVVKNIKSVYEIENPTNVFSKNYITPIITNTITEKTNKYFNIKIEEAAQSKVVLKDWDNKKHNLNYIGIFFTQYTNWSSVLYYLYLINYEYTTKNISQIEIMKEIIRNETIKKYEGSSNIEELNNELHKINNETDTKNIEKQFNNILSEKYKYFY